MTADGIPEDLVTPDSAARLQRWIDAGEPAVDIGRLTYSGSDEVRALVVETVEALPPAVRWHAIEFIEFIEIGRDAAIGTAGLSLPMRAPADDSAHRVKLLGTLSDDEIRFVIPHEVAHCYVKPYATARDAAIDPAFWSMPKAEGRARLLLLARGMGLSVPDVAQRLADQEYIAEAIAAAWGFARPPLHREAMRRYSGFVAELNDAAELVPSIERAAGETR